MTRAAVVGGGPAAGSAALQLAREGVPVVLFRPPLQGEKPCGGALPSYLVEELLGFDPSALPAVESPPALLRNGEGGELEISLEGLRIYRRGDLDSALVEAAVAAGATLVESRVARLELLDGSVELEGRGFRERFDWVVGGDGARGLCRRTLGLEPRGESFGLGASLPGVFSRRLVLAFPGVGDAYLWVFPRPGGISVGIAYTPGRLSHGAARACLERFLAQELGPGVAASGPRYRYPIPVYSSATLPGLRTGVDRRLLLVGDAAALADPLTREGIRYAVRSGTWAAEALLAGEPESYPGRVGRELGEEMARAGRARALFFEDPVAQWMVPVCRWHPGVAAVLADLLACRQGYRGLRRRLARAVVGPGSGG